MSKPIIEPISEESQSEGYIEDDYCIVQSFSDAVLGAIVVEDLKEQEKFGNWVSTDNRSNRRFSNIVMAVEQEQQKDIGSHINEGFDNDDDDDAFISTKGGRKQKLQFKNNQNSGNTLPMKNITPTSDSTGFQQDPNIPLDVKVERVSPYGQSFSPINIRRQHDILERGGSCRLPSRPAVTPMPEVTPQEAAALRTVKGLIRRSTHTGTPRENVQRGGKKSWRLLRDLSFSDTDGQTVKKFGALKIASDFPTRIKLQMSKKGITLTEEEKQAKIPDELVSHLVTLMEDLLDRGKVDHVAVIERESRKLVTSLPEWRLEKSDISGLVMSVISTHQTMLRILIDGEMYTCFKHGQAKMVGRADDNVMVAQATEYCVVVAHAMDDTPGSCLYEANAIASALENHGW